MEADTIVIVEDSPYDQRLIVRALKRHGVTNPIAVLHDGEEALDFFFANGTYKDRRATSIALTLLDLVLPKRDGFAVLAALRENETTRPVPVVVFSSSAEEEDILRSYELGANSYIRKPIDPDELSETIDRLGSYWLLLNEPPLLRT